VSTYSFVDTILHAARMKIKMGSPDAYGELIDDRLLERDLGARGA
jgi:hypothetical protein